MRKHLQALIVMSGTIAGTFAGVVGAQASDHDDGTTDMKTQNTNLTDVFVFRKDRATGNPLHADKLVVAVNLNPRSLPRQDYFFNTKARYHVHFSYVGESDNPGDAENSVNDAAPTGANDFQLTYAFGAPDSTTNVQAMTVYATRGGQTLLASDTVPTQPMKMDDLTVGTNSAAGTDVTLDGQTLTAFAGLRQDPFFFDVEQFFKVRDRARYKAATPLDTTTPFLGFDAGGGKDFVQNYNVLSIVSELPIDVINGNTATDVFDVWSTVEVKSL